jgi:NAD+ kinase
MRTPRIRIICRHKNPASALELVSREAEARGITVNDRSYDVAVAVGGDGTMIGAAVGGKPVMAVRYGSKNHLVDIPLEKVGLAFDMLLAGRFKEERYNLLEVASRKKRALAFNEVGITSVVPLPIGFSVSYLDTGFKAIGDGILVSTPQGSTGWSFSSNGSYLSHRSNAFIISLLNPVLTPLKSVVIPQVPVRIEVDTKDHRDRATLVADGNLMGRLGDGDAVSIRGSRKEAIIYRFFEHGFMRTMLGNGSDL